jgi:WD40 repeat protein
LTFDTKRDLNALIVMCFSPDGSQLVSTLVDRRLRKLVATRDFLASMEIKSGLSRVSFDIDGTSITLIYNDDKIQRWKISFAHSPNYVDDSDSVLSSLPMVFIPIHDTEPSALLDKSPHQCHRDRQGPWIIDKQNRRRLWVSLDSYISYHGEKVVVGSASGSITIVDFSNVKKLHKSLFLWL